MKSVQQTPTAATSKSQQKEMFVESSLFTKKRPYLSNHTSYDQLQFKQKQQPSQQDSEFHGIDNHKSLSSLVPSDSFKKRQIHFLPISMVVKPAQKSSKSDFSHKTFHSIFNQTGNVSPNIKSHRTTINLTTSNDISAQQSIIIPEEHDSITKRLQNLKKHYHAVGPPVNSSIVVKQLTQSQRRSMLLSPMTASTQRPYDLSHTTSQENIDRIDPFRKTHNSSLSYSGVPGFHPSSEVDENKRNQVQNSPYIQTTKAKEEIYPVGNFNSNSKKQQQQSHDLDDLTKKSTFVSMNPSIHISSPKNKSTYSSYSRNRVASRSQTGPFFQGLPSSSVFDGVEKPKKSASKISINKDDRSQTTTAAKNAFAKNTENYFKLEILNARSELCRKFILCTQYEAHRNYKSDTLQAEKVFLQSLDGIQVQLNDSLRLVNSAISVTRDITETDKVLTDLNNIAVASKSGYLQVMFLLLQAKVCFEYRDYVKCIHLAKRSKNLAQIYGYLHEKMKNYVLIGEAFNMLQKHKISIIYTVKVLRLSWLLGNENQELKAYDQLGKCYYYLGDLTRAYYFHEKMMTGELEQDQGIKSLSSSKLQNRGYQNNSSHQMRRINKGKQQNAKNNLNESNNSVTEEEELVSSSDDEFEVHMTVSKSPLEQQDEQNNAGNQHQDYQGDQDYSGDSSNYHSGDQSTSSSSYNTKKYHQNRWDDKLIMAKLKVLQIQRSKEMSSMQKKRTVLSGLAQDTLGKAECMMDLKNQEYLQKILSKRGKSTTIQKKYRISHLTPNRSILSYHEAEAQFIKLKNYSAMQQFIPTIDGQNLKNIGQILGKVKNFLSQVIPMVSQTLFQSPVFQKIQLQQLQSQQQAVMRNKQSSEQKPFAASSSQNQVSDQYDHKFKKMKEQDSNDYYY